MKNLTFRPGLPSDWHDVASLLTDAGLPLAGAQENLPGFLLAFQGDALAGIAGLERYGEAALLRSVVVARGYRGTGLGKELVGRLLDRAPSEGIRSVALLTTTADRFFERFGFVRVERPDLPSELHASAELKGACPASAVVMLLQLG